MVKLFPTIPEPFRYLVPDAPFYVEYDNWDLKATFDEDGLLHSYNDIPMRMNYPARLGTGIWENCMEFNWYSHGRISRGEGLSPHIMISPNAYSTSDGDKYLQSYGGMPSRIATSLEGTHFSFDWHKDGYQHRDDGLPASVIYDLEGNLYREIFYVNDLQHRSYSLPSDDSETCKEWRVQGVLHNTLGSAVRFIDKSGNMNAHGIEISETDFNAIKSLASHKRMPLYISFLVNMKITTLEHLDAFMDDAGAWKTSIPLDWVLRALNVTDEIFDEKTKEAEQGFDRIDFFSRYTGGAIQHLP